MGSARVLRLADIGVWMTEMTLDLKRIMDIQIYTFAEIEIFLNVDEIITQRAHNVTTTSL